MANVKTRSVIEFSLKIYTSSKSLEMNDGMLFLKVAVGERESSTVEVDVYTTPQYNAKKLQVIFSENLYWDFLETCAHFQRNFCFLLVHSLFKYL